MCIGHQCLIIFLTYDIKHYRLSFVISFIFTVYVALRPHPNAIQCGGWSGGAKVLGKLPVPGRPTFLITVRQGPIALAVGAGGGCLDVFTLVYHILFSFSLSLGDDPI